MKKIILLFLLISTSFALGQDLELIDSLSLVAKTAKEDTNKVKFLNRICVECRLLSDIDKGLAYGTEALTLAQKLNFRAGIAEAYTNLGNIYNLHDHYTEALKNYEAAIKLREELHDKKNMARLYNNIGVVYRKQGDYPQSLKYHFIALKAREEIKDKNGIASSYNNIGNIYLFQANYPEALKMYRATLKIMEEINDGNGIASSYNNIGNAYENQGIYPEALKNYYVALKKYEEIGEKEGTANLYGNIGVVYDHLGNRAEALKNYLASLKIEEELGDKDGIAITYLNIGTMYTALHNTKNAALFLGKALALSIEMNNKQLISNCYDYMAAVDSAKGDYRSAFEHQKLHVIYSDSLMNEENTRKTMHLQLNYEFEKKQDSLKAEQGKKDAIAEQQNKVRDLQLSRSRYMMGGLAGLLILSCIIGFLFVRQNKLRSRQRAMQLEQKLLRSQMNPHFIFNSLTAIESFIYTNEPKEAGRYLSGFAKLMRLILENSREEYISLDKEIKTLRYYLDLQKLRFEEKFDYKIILEGDLDAESIAIPPMLAQPFIENSIEHGIKNMETKGAIEIHFRKEGNEVHFEVKDNGIGMEKSLAIKEDKRSHQSLATKITQERLSILNRSKQGKIKLLIEELKDKLNNVIGTQVSFNIPFREI